MNIDIKISIIIPVYQAEYYIENCARSLFEQTMDGIEYIFINDNSTDSSIKVLKEVIDRYPDRAPYTKIINNPVNNGVAYTRSIGLKHATGKYIGWVDADDHVEINMFDEMYNAAKENQSDMVWCDFFMDGKIISSSTKEDRLSLINSMLDGSSYSFLWNKIFRREVIANNKIGFINNQNLGEDALFCFHFLTKCNKISYIPKVLYHYCESDSSLTRNLDKLIGKTYQEIENVKESFNILHENNIQIDEYSSNLYKLNKKRLLLSSTSFEDFLLWKRSFPETKKHIKYCDQYSNRQKVLAYICNSNFIWAIHIWIFVKKTSKRLGLNKHAFF